MKIYYKTILLISITSLASCSDASKNQDLLKNNTIETPEDSEYNTGVYYMNGIGVPIDYNEAIKHFKISSTQGDNDYHNAFKSFAPHV